MNEKSKLQTVLFSVQLQLSFSLHADCVADVYRFGRDAGNGIESETVPIRVSVQRHLTLRPLSVKLTLPA